jgi:hypothetical protein
MTLQSQFFDIIMDHALYKAMAEDMGLPHQYHRDWGTVSGRTAHSEPELQHLNGRSAHTIIYDDILGMDFGHTEDRVVMLMGRELACGAVYFEDESYLFDTKTTHSEWGERSADYDTQRAVYRLITDRAMSIGHKLAEGLKTIEPYTPLLDDRPNRRRGKGKKMRDWENR